MNVDPPTARSIPHCLKKPYRMPLKNNSSVIGAIRPPTTKNRIMSMEFSGSETLKCIKGYWLIMWIYVMPKIDIHPLAELFRTNVLKMLKQEGSNADL